MSDASATRIAIAPESAWGVEPGSGYAFSRYTGSGLESQAGVTRSREIKPNRGLPDTVRNDISAQGQLSVEYSINTYHQLLQNLMLSAWSTLVQLTAQSIDISAASGQTATATDAAAANAFADIVVGQWIKLGGFTNAGNNGFARVNAKASANEVDLEGLTFVNEAGETDITVNAQMIRIGTTFQSLHIEQQHPLSVGALYQLFPGCLVDSAQLTLRPSDIIQGSFAFIGKLGSVDTSSVAGTPTAATTTRVLNAINNVLSVRESDLQIASTLDFTEISINLRNNHAAKTAIGTLGAIGIRLGTPQLGGSLTSFFETKDQLEAFLDDTESAFSLQVQDAAGNADIFTMPSIKFTRGGAPIPGQNQDVFSTMAYEAQEDANGVSFQIDHFPV